MADSKRKDFRLDVVAAQVAFIASCRPVSTVEKLVSLPRGAQEIVLDTLREEGMEDSQLGAVIEKAKEIPDLSKTALKQSLQLVVEDLDELRGLLKLKRLHHSLGPANLAILLADKRFKQELDKAGINYTKFVAATKS